MLRQAALAPETQDVASGFRDAMRRLACTVCLITSADDGVWHGMTATAVASVSMSPCSLLVCINESTSLHTIVNHTRKFCVNLLSVEQAHLSGIFAGQRRGLSRFDVGNWAADGTGLPYLMDAQANVLCDVAETIHYETHTIFIGRVRGVRCADCVSPLLYQDGKLAASVPLGEA